jgi:hypothetical protein
VVASSIRFSKSAFANFKPITRSFLSLSSNWTWVNEQVFVFLNYFI